LPKNKLSDLFSPEILLESSWYKILKKLGKISFRSTLMRTGWMLVLKAMELLFQSWIWPRWLSCVHKWKSIKLMALVMV